MKNRLLLIFCSVAACVVLTVVCALKIYQFFPEVDLKQSYLLFLPNAQWVFLLEFAMMFCVAELMFLWGWNKWFLSVKGWKCFWVAIWYFFLCCAGSIALFLVLM